MHLVLLAACVDSAALLAEEEAAGQLAGCHV